MEPNAAAIPAATALRAPDALRRASNLNAANLLTLGRILMIPAILALLYVPGNNHVISRQTAAWAWCLYFVACMTDLVDGYVARRCGTVTTLGKLMDPLADKLMVCSLLIMMIPMGWIPAWIAVLVTAREIGVTALRGAAVAEGIVISASALGKAKSLLLDLGVGFAMLHYDVWLIPCRTVGLYLLGAGLAMSAWSAADYALRFALSLARKESAG